MERVMHDYIKQNWVKLGDRVILDCFKIYLLGVMYHI